MEETLSNSMNSGDGLVVSERVMVSSPNHTEAPSPVPAPLTEPSVVQAEHVDPLFIVNCQFIKDLSDDKITLKIMKSDTKRNYIREIINNDELWEKISVHFQNDFEKFYEMMKTSLENTNDYIQTEISYLSEDKIKIHMKHNGMFPFNFSFLVNKEEDRIEKMEQQIQFLVQQNSELTKKTEYIYEIIKGHSTWLQPLPDDYVWLKLPGMDSYQGKNALEETHSCYATLVENSKKTLLKKGWGGFCISNNGSTAYFRNKNYNQLIKNLTINRIGSAEPGKRAQDLGRSIVPDSQTWATDFYICIPTADIGIGLGETFHHPVCQTKKYHGRREPPRGSFFVYDKDPTGNSPIQIKDHIFETYLPPEIFCTNCCVNQHDTEPNILSCYCQGH